MPSLWTRIASSVTALGLFATIATAQTADSRPVPLTYGVKVSPWPTIPKSTAPSATYVMPDADFAPPHVPETFDRAGGVSATASPTRTPATSAPKTLYYRKESNAPVRPWAAAELTRPIAADEPANRPSASPPASSPMTDTVGSNPEKSLLPPASTFFTLDGEAGFVQRENQRRATEDASLPADKRRKPIDFPEFAMVPGSEGAFAGRVFPQQASLYEPNYVCYRRLFFEDRNAERYGWSLGPLQPFASAWKFVGDWIISPYRFGSQPFSRYECSAGLCLPGDHVPYLIYPPGLSATGAAVQTGVTLMLLFTIP